MPEIFAPLNRRRIGKIDCIGIEGNIARIRNTADIVIAAGEVGGVDCW